MRKYVFADEAGNFDFSRGPGASRYFILSTVTLDDCAVGTKLLELRRDMAWRGRSLDGELHAAKDAQAVRDEVFALLRDVPFRLDATILEKAKAQPQTRGTDERFYKYAWFFHFQYVAPRILAAHDELFLSAAMLGTRGRAAAFRTAVEGVVRQCSPTVQHRVAFWSAASDPCLQVADYCTWAVQRKWEGGDARSYELIKDKVGSEFDLWQWGRKTYY